MDSVSLHFLPEIINSHLIFQFLLAFLLAAIIGTERDMHGRPAGLRTNILVSLGACGFAVLSVFSSFASDGTQIADPTRISAQIITGIGFIGAGAILKQGFNIKGLTTAATLWISAAIGMACGHGYGELAIVCTSFGLVTLQLLNVIERLLPKDLYRRLEIKSDLDSDISEVVTFLNENKVRVVSVDHKYDYETGQALHLISLKMKTRNAVPLNFPDIREKLDSSKAKIFSITWTD